MPSSYTASLRFELQFTGENINLWGSLLNGAITRIDTSVAGWFTKALTGNYTLTTANGTADEARNAMLKFTGTGAFTVTIPAVSKRYDVWNACTDVLTVSNGSASVTVLVGEKVSVITDGSGNIARVQPTDFGGATLTSVTRVTGLSTPSANSDAATKKYVDDTAFAAQSGILPGQTGNADKVLGTDGSVAGWVYAVKAASGLATMSDYTLTVSAAAASDVRAGSDTGKAATVGGMYGGLAEVALTYSSSNIVTSGSTLDNTAFVNGSITLTQNSTIPNLTNPVVGRVGRIRLTQDGTTARTLSYGGNFKFPGNVTPTMTTTLGAVAFLDYEVVSSTYIRANLTSMG